MTSLDKDYDYAYSYTADGTLDVIDSWAGDQIVSELEYSSEGTFAMRDVTIEVIVFFYVEIYWNIYTMPQWRLFPEIIANPIFNFSGSHLGDIIETEIEITTPGNGWTSSMVFSGDFVEQRTRTTVLIDGEDVFYFSPGYNNPKEPVGSSYLGGTITSNDNVNTDYSIDEGEVYFYLDEPTEPYSLPSYPPEYDFNAFWEAESYGYQQD